MLGAYIFRPIDLADSRRVSSALERREEYVSLIFPACDWNSFSSFSLSYIHRRFSLPVSSSSCTVCRICCTASVCAAVRLPACPASSVFIS